jgi:hypothetical protein
MRVRSLAIVVGIVLMGLAAVRANQATPLPDLALMNLEGTALKGQTELPSGKWLLVYVQPNCRPCDRLLNLVKQDENPGLASRMVIVAGGVDRATAAAARDKLRDLADARWYTDQSGKASAALKMSGVPMVFGVRDKMIEWRLSGVLPADSKVKSILASWVAE